MKTDLESRPNLVAVPPEPESDQAWQRLFPNGDLGWRNEVGDALQAHTIIAQWAEQGIGAGDTLRWLFYGYTPETAREAINAGYTDPNIAAGQSRPQRLFPVSPDLANFSPISPGS